MPQGFEPQSIEVEKPVAAGTVLELPLLMDWFDEFVPFSFSLRSEETRPIKIEEIVDGNELTIRAELPGVDPDRDIEVSVDDGYLTIRGERREEHGGADRSDFHYGSFIRSIALPSGIDENSVHATYRDGVLEVKVESLASSSEMKRITVKRG